MNVDRQVSVSSTQTRGSHTSHGSHRHHHHHRHSHSHSRHHSDHQKKPETFDLRHIGSYETAVETFRKYDLDNNGRFSFNELHALMVDLNQRKGIEWTRNQTDSLMHRLDKKNDGGISIEEFIQYIFPNADAMGGTAGNSGYEQVMAAFRRHDADRNGKLDAEELTNLMQSLHPGQWNRELTDQVFHVIDKDRNGWVDSDELIAWMFGVPRERQRAAKRTAKGNDDAGPLVEINFTFGADAVNVVDKVATRWKSKFGHQLSITKTISGRSQNVLRVTARDGQVVFWDAASMLAYRDNPFENHTTSAAWCEDMIRRHIPRLIAGT